MTHKFLQRYHSLFGETDKQYGETTADNIRTFADSCVDLNEVNLENKIVFLWVIDMQKDFIDDPFEDEPLKKDENNVSLVVESRNKQDDKMLDIGRFAVSEGIHCVDDVIYYIDKLNEKTDCDLNVIASRDYHQEHDKNPTHCSFKKLKESDPPPFPAHCVQGSNGTLLNDKISEKLRNLKENKLTIIFKGCNGNTESFGSYPYSCVGEKNIEYTDGRQQHSCGKTSCSIKKENKLPNTGGYYFRDRNQNQYIDHNDPINNSFAKTTRTTDYQRGGYNGILGSVTEKITDVIRQESQTGLVLADGTTSVPKTGGVVHFVCGLAGDYCVRDTAINIRNGNKKHEVYVLADATRYAALPAFVLNGSSPTENVSDGILNGIKGFTFNQQPFEGKPQGDSFLLTYKTESDSDTELTNGQQFLNYFLNNPVDTTNNYGQYESNPIRFVMDKARSEIQNSLINPPNKRQISINENVPNTNTPTNSQPTDANTHTGGKSKKPRKKKI